MNETKINIFPKHIEKIHKSIMKNGSYIIIYVYKYEKKSYIIKG